MLEPNAKGHEVRTFALGGLGEIGKNMYCVEYRDELIIIDSGLLFPDERLLGIDYVIPDYTYLVENQSKIKALVITHGHEDHIGGIPFLLQSVFVPTIYASGLSYGLIKAKMEEHPSVSINLQEYHESDIISFKYLHISFFRTNHSIPDSFAVKILTPHGSIVHTGDFKFDFSPISKDANYQKMARIGDEGLLCLMSDSTNAELETFTTSEKVIAENIKDLFKNIPGRIIISTFASNVHRIQQIVEASSLSDRKIAVFGRSMEKNIDVGVKLGYIRAPYNAFVYGKMIQSIKDENLTILCTGSQGEPLAALTRIAHGTHRQIKLVPGDTVILSSSPIPGNQESINRIINLLYKKGANVITQSPFADVHASGHGSQNELKLMIKLLKPKYFVPVHGEYRMLKTHADLALEAGVKKANIFLLENGSVLSMNKQNARISHKIPVEDIYIDGTLIQAVKMKIIKDRKELSEDGLLSVIVPLNKNPLLISKIVSKGFIYSKNKQAMIEDMRSIIALNLKDKLQTPINTLKEDLKKALSRYIFDKTKREPLIEVIFV